MTRINQLVALVALVALAGNASALYIQTPLLLDVDQEADVGDVLVVTVRPENETAAAKYAGATVRVLFTYDANESGQGAASPEEPVDASDFREHTILDTLVLDDQAQATFGWTVPAEVDGHNVDLVIEQGAERLAFAYLAVGDAPPMMRILAGSGPAPDGIGPDTEQDPEPADDGEDADQEDAQDTPGFGLLAALAALGAVVVLRRRV